MTNSIEITESRMKFGPFPREDLFYIEKSEIYKNLGSGVKIVEFVLLKEDKLLIIEAKSSSPRSINQEKFKTFVWA